MSYDVSLDYSKDGQLDIDSSPGWCLAVFRLGRPISYSRKVKMSIGDVVTGALLRKEIPIIITSDCINMKVDGSKASSVKTLNCTLKGDVNYFSINNITNGDWIMGWMHSNPQDTDKVITALNAGNPANNFTSGLKFIGRVHSIRRRRVTSGQGGVKTVYYTLQAIGFDELNTVFFYDPALATLDSTRDVWRFLAQIGLDAFKYLSEAHKTAGQIQDNSEDFFDKFLDIVVGKGIKSTINAGEDLNGNKLLITPQQQTEAPYSYLVPLSVATVLGRTTADERKGDDNGHRAFGYADILTTLTGVQKYKADSPISPHKGFLPDIDFTKSIGANRLRCTERIKGTYIPIEPVFINTPLWNILNQFKNPTINEMYTCIKPNLAGDLMPTIVFRQIPFSTEAIEENEDMPLTRFLSLPRWIVPGSLVTDEDLGKSNATHFNFIHVYGQVSPYQQKKEYSITDQMTRNAPIIDTINVASHGLKPYMSTVACSINDAIRKDGARVWMEAIADWSIGSEHTLNGTLTCKGIQSPIAEGDNIEYDGVAYQIESVSHSCGINDGFKFFDTSLSLSNGMPIDQGFQNGVAPRYPGFKFNDENSIDSVLGNETQNQGDDKFSTALNPGISVDRA